MHVWGTSPDWVHWTTTLCIPRRAISACKHSDAVPMKTQSKQVWRASRPHLLQAGLQTVSNTRNPNRCCPPSFSSPLSPPALPGEPDLHHPKSLYSKQTCGINKNSSHVLFLPADSLFLVGGAGPPGASFLLAGRQVFLLTHSTAAPRLRAIDGRH